MASGAKRKTTMAKRDRENTVRERRARKQAKRDAKRHAPAEPPAATGEFGDGDVVTAPSDSGAGAGPPD
jgi:hypothetical protein